MCLQNVGWTCWHRVFFFNIGMSVVVGGTVGPYVGLDLPAAIMPRLMFSVVFYT